MKGFLFFLWVIALLLAATGFAAGYYTLLAPLPSFALCLLALLFTVIAFLISFVQVMRKEKGFLILSSFVLGLFTTSAFAYFLYLAVQNPINDLVTNHEKPTEFQKKTPVLRGIRGADLTKSLPNVAKNYPQDFSYMQKTLYPALFPVRLKVQGEEAMALVKKTVQADFPDWVLVYEDPYKQQLEYEIETRFFHFVDDFAIQIINEKEGATAHMRSRSRVGRSDLGVNAERMQKFIESLKAHNLHHQPKPKAPAAPATPVPGQPAANTK